MLLVARVCCKCNNIGKWRGKINDAGKWQILYYHILLGEWQGTVTHGKESGWGWKAYSETWVTAEWMDKQLLHFLFIGLTVPLWGAPSSKSLWVRIRGRTQLIGHFSLIIIHFFYLLYYTRFSSLAIFYKDNGKTHRRMIWLI